MALNIKKLPNNASSGSRDKNCCENDPVASLKADQPRERQERARTRCQKLQEHESNEACSESCLRKQRAQAMQDIKDSDRVYQGCHGKFTSSPRTEKRCFNVSNILESPRFTPAARERKRLGTQVVV